MFLFLDIHSALHYWWTRQAYNTITETEHRCHRPVRLVRIRHLYNLQTQNIYIVLQTKQHDRKRIARAEVSGATQEVCSGEKRELSGEQGPIRSHKSHLACRRAKGLHILTSHFMTTKNVCLFVGIGKKPRQQIKTRETHINKISSFANTSYISNRKLSEKKNTVRNIL